MDDAIARPSDPPSSASAPLAYAVELDGVAIGVALPVRGGYVFRTADTAFRALDGCRFRGVRQMRQAAGALRRKLPKSAP